MWTTRPHPPRSLLPAKTWVYGLPSGENARAYPLRDLARTGVTNGGVGDREVVDGDSQQVGAGD